MEEILKKGHRVVSPKWLRVSLRPAVYNWLADIAAENSCSASFVVRALLEDAYDYGEHPSSDQEVTE